MFLKWVRAPVRARGEEEEEGIMSTQLASFTQPAERRAADKDRLGLALG